MGYICRDIYVLAVVFLFFNSYGLNILNTICIYSVQFAKPSDVPAMFGNMTKPVKCWKQTVLVLFNCHFNKSIRFYWTSAESYKSHSANDQKKRRKKR